MWLNGNTIDWCYSLHGFSSNITNFFSQSLTSTLEAKFEYKDNDLISLVANKCKAYFKLN